MRMGNLKAMSRTQRLTYVFCLFLNAPTADKAKRVEKEFFEFYSRGLTVIQIDACKSMARQLTE